MTLLIDGHNLIGAGVFSDIHLSDEDDEAKLVARLKVWRSRIRRKMVVFFDRGIPGGRDHRMSGSGVEVVFAANPTEADDLIRRRLRQAPRHTVLVSNDDALAREAEVYGLERWRGYEFMARMALRLPDLPVPEPGEEWDVRLSKAEVEEWLEVFRAARRAKRAKRQARKVDSTSGASTTRRAGAKVKKGRRTTQVGGVNGGDPTSEGRTASGKRRRSGTADPATSSQADSAQANLDKTSSGKKKAAKSKPAKQSQRKARKSARGRNRLRG